MRLRWTTWTWSDIIVRDVRDVSRRLEPSRRIYGCFPSVDSSAGSPKWPTRETDRTEKRLKRPKSSQEPHRTQRNSYWSGVGHFLSKSCSCFSVLEMPRRKKKFAQILLSRMICHLNVTEPVPRGHFNGHLRLFSGGVSLLAAVLVVATPCAPPPLHASLQIRESAQQLGCRGP